ncbi:MAG: cyclic nucleotide-binding domain-containing protein [Chitinispirillia bacterium]
MSESAARQHDKIGSNRNITTMNERIFKRGTLMFIEGELSTEMFIIRSGKIRILKQEGEKTVELAVLGPGSVLGELSLLDKQPRSATAQVIEDVKASVIDEKLFNHTMKSITNWLANIIILVVKRLRDTLKLTSDSIVERSIAGVIKIILLLHNSKGISGNNEIRILLSKTKDVISSTIGIGEIEIENVLLHLILKEMLIIRKDDYGKEYIIVNDPSVLNLYMSYLRSSQNNTKLLGEDLPESAVEFVKVLIETGEKLGRSIQPGILQIAISQLKVEWQRQGKGKFIDTAALDLLIDNNIIFIRRDTIKSNYQSHKNDVLVFNKNTLEKIITLHIWLSIFREDVIF